MKRIYLDNASTTEMHPDVIESMVDVMKNNYGNASSTHIFGRQAKALIEMARKNIAGLFNVSPAEIFFTSSGTESNNLVIRSCVKDLGVTRIVTSGIEHKCVVETIAEMEKLDNVTVERVKILSDGSIDHNNLEEILKSSDNKTLVSLMHANNEIGNLLDIEQVSSLCKEQNAYFHTDTVQSIAHYKLDFKAMDIDFASCSAHKFHGPKGIGFVYVRRSIPVHAIITGGGQERMLRSGTENVYGIVGMEKALQLAYANLERDTQYLRELKSYAIEALKNKIPEIAFNGKSGDIDNSLHTLLSIRLPFKDNLIGFELELNGIAISQGSACSSGASKVSSVIQSLFPKEVIENITPLRVSFSIYNTKNDIDVLVESLKKITEKYLQSIEQVSIDS